MGTDDSLLRFKNKTIAVLSGGLSSEREISIRSGESISRSLKNLGLQTVNIDVTKSVYNDLINEKVDLAFIALHGKYGEDGSIQGLLDLMKIPYTGSGILGSAIGMNKLATKRILSDCGIPVPPSVPVDWTDLDACLDRIRGEVGFPSVLKPLCEGSSIGVIIVKNDSELKKALTGYRTVYSEAYVEKYIPGREITVGLIGKEGNIRVLPIMELKPKKEFYDFEAKYTQGKTDFDIPAKIRNDKEPLITEYAKKGFRELYLSGVVRFDAILDENDNPYFLEVNTIPGMTETSDIPAMAKAAGMSFDDVVSLILDCVPANGEHTRNGA